MSADFRYVQIGKVATPIERPERPVAGKIYRQIGVRWWGEGVYEREPIDGADTQYAVMNVLDTNDIVMNKIWARHGSVSVVQPELAGCYCSMEFPIFRPNENELDPRWFYWITKTQWFWNLCDEKSQGTSGKNRIRPDRFLQIEIPLPPLPEQLRIVAKIERLAGKIEEARTTSKQSRELAEVLLERRLAALRSELFDSDCPSVLLGELTNVTSGGTPNRDVIAYWNGDIPWIKTGELRDGDIHDASEYITEAGLENSSAKLFPTDTILVALYGQGQTRGRTGRLRIAAATNQACCAILPKPNLLDSRFTQYWLRSFYTELREESRGGAQPNWNSGMIKRLTIVLPAIDRQRAIIENLDRLRFKIDSLATLQSQAAAELDALMPSILDRAFKGEL